MKLKVKCPFCPCTVEAVVDDQTIVLPDHHYYEAVKTPTTHWYEVPDRILIVATTYKVDPTLVEHFCMGARRLDRRTFLPDSRHQPVRFAA